MALPRSYPCRRPTGPLNRVRAVLGCGDGPAIRFTGVEWSAVRELAERFGTFRYRRHAIWVAPVVCVVLIAGCGSGSGGSKATAKKAELGPSANVGIATGAYTPAIAGMTRNRVFIWGGRSLERGDRSDPGSRKDLASGRIVSLVSGKSAKLPPAPFTTPVGSTQAAAVGDQVVVIGQSCPTWRDSDAGRKCEPGSLVGALYDGASDIWHSIDFQDGAAESIHTYPTIEASDAGFALVSSKAEPDALVVVAAVAPATARRLAKPPLGPPPPGGSAASVTAWLSGSTAVLVEPPAPRTGPTVARAHVMSVDSAAWRTIASPPGITASLVTCVDGGALVSNGFGSTSVWSGWTWPIGLGEK